MAIEEVFVKTLTKTDITKRLSVPTKKKICFLDFGGQHNVPFKATDKNGKAWAFGCSRRKTKGYPKPVISKGWVQFVKSWKLRKGDKVILYRQTMGNAGGWRYLIDVNRGEALPLIQNCDADRVMAVASYTDDYEGETTVTSDITDKATADVEEQTAMSMSMISSDITEQAVTDDQTEGIRNQHGFMFEFISLKPDIAVNELKFNGLGSQEQREEDRLCILTLQNTSTDETPVTGSAAHYFNFL